MKRMIASAIILLTLFGIIPFSALAAESNLIEDLQISLKSTENPNRLEISFNLTEPIDLSQGNANIIVEYFTVDDSENLKAIPYYKDKSWSGYLNSYDNYPAGERKYSSGKAYDNYSDTVPATKIYTSTKTNARIDVASVAAVRVTVLRADGSGERITIHSSGTISDIEVIEADVVDQDKNMGIITSDLPVDTILVADELTGGPVYEQTSSLLTDVKHFIAIDITLESNGNRIQPNGKVKISIPIPEYFNNSNLAVYRIDDSGEKIPYSVAITTHEGIEYATFEADHFSVYVLAEMLEKESETAIPNGTITVAETRRETGIESKRGENAKEEAIKGVENEAEKNGPSLRESIPQTGVAQTRHYSVATVIISVFAIILLIINRQKE